MRQLDTIKIFCRRTLRIAHKHPNVREVEAAADRPWLGEMHEHQIEVTVTQLCSHTERSRDLLTLQNVFDDIVRRNEQTAYDDYVWRCRDSSFEALCTHIAELFECDSILLHSVRIEADGGVEGAEVTFK